MIISFDKSCVRILLPPSITIAVTFLFCGTTIFFKGKDAITTLQDDGIETSHDKSVAFIV